MAAVPPPATTPAPVLAPVTSTASPGPVEISLEGKSLPGSTPGDVSPTASGVPPKTLDEMEFSNRPTCLTPSRIPAQREHFYYHNHSKPRVEVTYHLRIMCGNSNAPLAAEVAAHMKVPLCQAKVAMFPNGESNIHILDAVRGDDCFIVQPTVGSEGVEINTAMMELLLMIHTLRLSSAKRVTAIIPYFGYCRQDRKTQARVPISASAVAQLIQSMGVDRVVTVDLHCGQIQGFFRNMPLDNLQMNFEFANFIKQRSWFNPTTTVVVAPDAGGVERASRLADELSAHHIVTILKRRVEAGKVDSMQTVGTVEGYDCVIVDDMVDTGGTLVKACELLQEMKARRVLCCATHGLLTHPALNRINACSALDELIVSDSIPQANNVKQCSKLTVLSIAPLLSETIRRLHREESVSDLFVAHRPALVQDSSVSQSAVYSSAMESPNTATLEGAAVAKA